MVTFSKTFITRFEIGLKFEYCLHMSLFKTGLSQDVQEVNRDFGKKF